MFSIYRSMPYLASCLALTGLLAAAGCHSAQYVGGSPPMHTAMPVQNVMPRELSKVILPPYTIEPPDILVIDEVYLVPPPSYELRPNDTLAVKVQRDPSDPLKPGDVLDIEVAGFPDCLSVGDVVMIQVEGVPEDAPIAGQFQVESDGQIRLVVPRFEERVELGPDGRQAVRREVVGMSNYGSVHVDGLTIREAEKAIADELRKTWKNIDETKVWMTFAETTAQPIQGPYRILPRGDIFLGLPYGLVNVAGQTVEDATEAIRSCVSEVLSEPDVTVTLDTFAAAPIDGYYTVQLDGTIDLNAPAGGQAAGAAGPRAGWGAEIAPEPGQQRPPGVPEGRGVAPEGPSGAGPAGRAPATTAQALPGQPIGPGIAAVFIEPIRVAGLRVDEARQVIKEQLREHFTYFDVSVTLAAIAGQQQIIGEHLVRQDGNVTLGDYGSVPVVGLTIEQAKTRIEAHLSQFFQRPKVSVDVFSYNSKKYYIITQGAGLGDGVYPFPITGNETVLDAISNVNGLGQVSSKRIWIARPTPEPGKRQILPVNWEAITAQASPATNYQILPGDRIFIAEDKLIAFDTAIAKLTAPIERIMGFALLGVGTVTRFSGPVLRGGGSPGGGIGF